MNLFDSLVFFSLFISGARSLQIVTGKPPSTCFSFDFSANKRTLQQISLLGNATLTHSVRLSAPAGTVTYKQPLNFVGNYPVLGFSTHFTFSTIPENVANFGELCFFLLPKNNGNGDSLFKLNSMLELGLPANSISVKLVSNNKTENLIKINVGSDLVAQSSDLSRPDLTEQLYCLIIYNGVSKRMEVRVSESKDSTMTSAFLSYPVDLTTLLLNERFFVGMRYSSGNSTQNPSVRLNSWSFSVKQQKRIYSMHSEPLDPRSFVVPSSEDRPANHTKRAHPWGFLVVTVFPAVCAVLLMWYAVVSRWKAASREDGACLVHAGYEKILMFELEAASN